MANCASKWPSLFEPLKFQSTKKFLHCIVISLDDYDLWNTYVCSSSVVQISPPLYICQKIIMHRVIIIALYIVYCKWYSTWYAFFKQFFEDRVEVLIVKESNLCWIYWWIFIAIFQLHRYRHKTLLYSAFVIPIWRMQRPTFFLFR